MIGAARSAAFVGGNTPSAIRNEHARMWSAITRSELEPRSLVLWPWPRPREVAKQVDVVVAVHALHDGRDALSPTPVSTDGFGSGIGVHAARSNCMNTRFQISTRGRRIVGRAGRTARDLGPWS
jgi:hypothetical protein